MAAQSRRDTQPEMALRRALHASGYRYRVDWPLPGLPRRRADIAFPARRVAVFVDGCFWHRCPSHKSAPANNREWWAAKLAANVERDRHTDDHLRRLGWTVVRVWEHEPPDEAVEIVVDVLQRSARRLNRPRNSRTSLPG
jgi:DNA mismatch endonuclease, patch repair protein